MLYQGFRQGLHVGVGIKVSTARILVSGLGALGAVESQRTTCASLLGLWRSMFSGGGFKA